MKWVLRGLVALFLLVVLFSFNEEEKTDHTAYTLSYFKNAAADFTASTLELKNAVGNIKDGDTTTVIKAIEALKTARLQYKRIEFFMEYFYTFPVNMYNRAPVYEVEEPDMEFQRPIGMQVMEGLFYDKDVYAKKQELQEQADVIYNTATSIPATLYNFKCTDQQVLEAIRLEVIRILTLGTTGYDAPQMKTGIKESAIALKAVQDNIAPFLTAKNSQYAEGVRTHLQAATDLLEKNTDFDKFDRMSFLTKAILPLQKQLGLFIKEQGLELNTYEALNYDTENLFSPDAINLKAFSSLEEEVNNTQLIALGKRLFFEKNLSGNATRNCATCHDPKKYFTDGLAKSLALDGTNSVKRNAPTLLYAAYQHGQFQDSRAGSLEEQIKIVLQNPIEMNADLKTVVKRLSTPQYKALFKIAYPRAKKDSLISITHIASAIAAYEQSLAPFNSPFDHYIKGEATALNASQIRGYNLFMGKAQCGSCHFAPLFNNLLPPYYNITELEILGVPANDDFKHPIADKDSGRYQFFAIQYNNGAFKTPTVRNAAKTAPYMHNGSLKTLKQVIDFYNKGGGQGIGLDVPEQTLSPNELHLTEPEIQDIIHFIEALTDPVQPA